MMKILIIHLERATDRKERMDAELIRVGLRAEYVPAVDGKTGDFTRVDYCHSAALKLFGRGLSAGEAACSMSHAQAWQCVAADSEPVLILEDDCLLCRDAAWLERVSTELPEGFDFVHIQRNDGWPVMNGEVRGRFQRCFRVPYGSCAYAVSPKGAKELLRRAFPIAEPVDVFLSRVAIELEAYVLADNEFLAIPAPGPSLVNG